MIRAQAFEGHIGAPEILWKLALSSSACVGSKTFGGTWTVAHVEDESPCQKSPSRGPDIQSSKGAQPKEPAYTAPRIPNRPFIASNELNSP